MRLDDPAIVARDYESETHLLARRSIYETSEGPSAPDRARRLNGIFSAEKAL